MTDPDIQFGDLERVPIAKRSRPDQNGHLAIATVYSPESRDLPIFVDLDAMRDMLDHAHSDTRVELGGVLIGGQYEDATGAPFVMVTDYLRAKHYQSTKGSFTFTHDTWEQITRDREQFPSDSRMVGWFHTHPGWGVFLSGLDLFICDHFFNQPLDVALVIDPCQRDSGFFQWANDETERVRRTGGFSLFASRFRAEELRAVAAELEGQVMPEASRFTPGPVTVQLPAGVPPWQSLAATAMMVCQIGLLLILVLRWPQVPASGTLPATADWAELRATVDRLERSGHREAEIDAKLEVLELVLRQGGQAPAGVLQNLAERGQEIEQLRASLRAQQSLSQQLDGKIAKLESEVAAAQCQELARLDEIKNLRSQLASLDQAKSGNAQPIGQPTDTAQSIQPGAELQQTGWLTWLPEGWSFGVGLLAGAILGGGALLSVLRRESDSPAEPVENGCATTDKGTG